MKKYCQNRRNLEIWGKSRNRKKIPYWRLSYHIWEVKHQLFEEIWPKPLKSEDLRSAIKETKKKILKLRSSAQEVKTWINWLHFAKCWIEFFPLYINSFFFYLLKSDGRRSLMVAIIFQTPERARSSYVTGLSKKKQLLTWPQQQLSRRARACSHLH